MPRIPDYVENKFAQKVQGFLIFLAIIFGLISWGLFDGGHNGFKPGLIAFALFVGGCMIKTKKKYVGGTGVYK